MCFKEVTYAIDPVVSVLESYPSFILSFVVSNHWFYVIIIFHAGVDVMLCRLVSRYRHFGTVHFHRGPGSSVCTATDYGLDGPGTNPGGDEIFRLSRPALGPTQPPVKCVPGLSRG